MLHLNITHKCTHPSPLLKLLKYSQALYLAKKPFFILMPSHFMHIEEFAILFMGKGIEVRHMLPAEATPMAWYIWDGSMKNKIGVKYVFHYANMSKMDYHAPELSQTKEAYEMIGDPVDMLYETDLNLIRKLGASASETLHQSEGSSSSEVNNFSDDVSVLSNVNDLGESNSSWA
jgi:hypothetical protein